MNTEPRDKPPFYRCCEHCTMDGFAIAWHNVRKNQHTMPCVEPNCARGHEVSTTSK